MGSINIAKLASLLKSLVGFNSFITPEAKGLEIKEGEIQELAIFEDSERHRIIGLLNDIEVQAEILRFALLHEDFGKEEIEEEE